MGSLTERQKVTRVGSFLYDGTMRGKVNALLEINYSVQVPDNPVTTDLYKCLL